MNVPVFLAEREQLLAGDRVRLQGAEGKHAAAARRLTPGERVDLTDGAGLLAQGVVTGTGRDELEVEVHSCTEASRPAPQLAVVQALPKGDRGERAVEAMSEAGVDAVIPWAARRCVTRWHPGRGEKALGRWRAKAREAAKQSGRVFVPEIEELAQTDTVAAQLSAATFGVVLDGEAPCGLASLPLPEPIDARETRDRAAAGHARDAAGGWGSGPGGCARIVVVVGPEGGVTPEESAEFEAAGATRARLGPTILRTSTAGVAAAAVLFARCGRW